jgi:DNA-binding NtrC family response regulator
MARREPPMDGLTELAAKIRELSHARWGPHRDTAIVGLHTRMVEAQHRLLVCAQADSPVLITGETGTGKELVARAMHLLSRRRAAPYLCVNCAQYQDGQLIASELFGHRKGSFTGAVSDHRGIFEEADGGIVFLDEIAELSPAAQAMLLRTLGEGEILPVGESRPRTVNVRVFAATGRDLRAQVARGLFREDLYYRLRYLQVRVPPLRERGNDWELIAQGQLRSLATSCGTTKMLSDESRRLLHDHQWPGNVRELRSVIETAFHLCTGTTIEPADFAGDIDEEIVAPPAAAPVPTPVFGVPAPLQIARELAAPGAATVAAVYRAMVSDKQSFWALVYEPFMARDMSRTDARAIVERGLFDARGSYKRLLAMFNIESNDYLRFMDFLRHHRLKPDRIATATTDDSLPPLVHGLSEIAPPQGQA